VVALTECGDCCIVELYPIKNHALYYIGSQ
jgi:hypothetical protein